MEPHFSEDDDVERVKRWWREYGRAIVIGVVIGLLVMAGTRYWMDYQQGRAQHAALAYEQVMAALEAGDYAKVVERGQGLREHYEGTPYADLAALAIARAQVANGHPDAAVAPLKAVAEGGAMAALKEVAQLRLARVLLASGKPQEALDRVKSVQAGAFRAQFEALAGDAHRALNQPKQAREAYERALAAMAPDDALRQAVQIKRNELLAPAAAGDKEGTSS